jgi:gluconate 2-dehydrogenase gamma chain
MDRRKYLKTLAVGSLGASALLSQSCETPKEKTPELPASFTIDRTPDELLREQKLLSETFFDEHEMKTILLLADIIIPKDETSGSAQMPRFLSLLSLL